MPRLRPASIPPVGLGMTSLVLGTIGLMLFFLPILGIPISGSGMVAGVIGLVAAIFGWSPQLRTSLAGIGICFLALAAGFAVAFAPAGYIAHREPLPMWQPIPNRPYVPPPARPDWWLIDSPAKQTPRDNGPS